MVDYWPLAIIVALAAASFAALYLLRLQVWRESKSDSARMARALGAARDAIGKTPERKRRAWARVRLRLAMLLTESGGRWHDRERLEEAAGLLDEAIPVLGELGLLGEKATALYYRGRTEWGRANKEAGTAGLEQAVATFRELMAIEPWPRHLLRAVIISLPAIILVDIGERKDDPDIIEQGLALCREAVAAARRRIGPEWCIAYRNLSHVLGVIGRRNGDEALLEEAISAAREATAAVKLARYPNQWLMTQATLGYALGALGELRGDAGLLEESLAVLEAARETAGPEFRADGRAVLTLNAGSSRIALGQLKRDPAMLGQAVEDLRAALDAFRDAEIQFAGAETARMLGQALAALAELTGEAEVRQQAAEQFRAALAVFATNGASRHLKECQDDLRDLESPPPGPAGPTNVSFTPGYDVK